MTDQEIRAKALAIAAQMQSGNKVRIVVKTAERLAEWIRTGELPALPPGEIE